MKIILKYKIDVLDALKKQGYSTYKIRQNKIFTEGQLQAIREDRLVTQPTLEKLCYFLDCQPGDLLEYIRPESIEKFNKEQSLFFASQHMSPSKKHW